MENDEAMAQDQSEAKVESEQATDVAGLSSAAAPERSDDSGGGNQHYEVFTVEFLLNDDNEVKRTRVVHVPSSQEDKWPGWATKELLDFMTGHGAPRMRPEVGLPAGTPVVHEQVRRPAVTPATAPRPRVRRLEALPAGTAKPRWLLPANQPFTVQVSLDVPEPETVGEQAAEYFVSVAARPVGEGPRQAIGEVHGRLGAPANLRVQSPGLRPGLYRLEGAVELGTTSEKPLKFLPPLEGGVIDVS